MNFIAARGQTIRKQNMKWKLTVFSETIIIYNLLQFNMHVNLLKHSYKINRMNRNFGECYQESRKACLKDDLYNTKERESINFVWEESVGNEALVVTPF